MTMRISPHQLICGQPALRVRAFFRSVRQYVATDEAEQHFALSPSAASRFIRALVREGYLERSDLQNPSGTTLWMLTDLGDRLANATAAPPLTRRSADRLVAQLVGRIHNANEAPFAYRIHRAFVFGSYLDMSRDRVNDVDIAVALFPRFADRDRHFDYGQERTELARDAGRQFANFSDVLFWPLREVVLFLRQRRRGLSLMLIEPGETERVEFVIAGPHRQLFPPSDPGTPAEVHRGRSFGEQCSCADALRDVLP